MTAKKILIIEDEKMLKDALIERLVGEGYVVYGSSNSEEAFVKISEDRPDIILTDLILSGTNGFEILKKLKQDSELRDIPVLMLSSLEGGENVAKAMSLGAKDFLVKSDTSLSEIVDRIKKVLKSVSIQSGQS